MIVNHIFVHVIIFNWNKDEYMIFPSNKELKVLFIKYKKYVFP